MPFEKKGFLGKNSVGDEGKVGDACLLSAPNAKQ